MSVYALGVKIVLVIGMLVYGSATMFLPELSRVSWVAGGLSTCLGIVGALYIFKSRGNLPFFVAALAWLIGLSSLSTLLQSELFESVAGIRRYHQMWGLVFAMWALKFSLKDFSDWIRFFWVVGLVQLPFCIYQRFILVPLREGMDIPFMVPVDVVAGTFGATLEGGGTSGEMALFMVVMLFGLYQFRRMGLVSKRLFRVSLFLFFIPLMLGETKSAFVYLGVGALLVVRRELLENPGKALGVILFAVTFISAYFVAQAQQELVDTPDLEQTLAYNFGDDPHGSRVLNRSTTIVFWYLQHGLDEPISLLLGDGLGSAHDTESEDVLGENARRFRGLGIDLTDMSSFLWDTGLVGYLLLCVVYLAAYHRAGRLLHRASRPIFIAYLHTFRFFCLVGLLNTWVTRSLSDAPVLQLFSAMMFGMLCLAIKLERIDRSSSRAIMAPNGSEN